MKPTHQTDRYALYHGDCLEVLPTLEAGSVQTCVTSPPYFGLRDYGHDDQIGLEETPEQYVSNLVNVFREVRRVLADDGTLWLNLGDSYNSGGEGVSGWEQGRQRPKGTTNSPPPPQSRVGVKSLKRKDLIGIPWRVAFALQADGWYLRQDIIWHKPNPMPESVTDRCTKAHEYIFLLSKSERYYYDHEAIKEPAVSNGVDRGGGKKHAALAEHDELFRYKANLANIGGKTDRNKRSVWTVSTKPYPEAHFATFNPELITPCILAGAPEGGTVLDPFMGSGTTIATAVELGRKGVGIDLSYLDLSFDRVDTAARLASNAAGDFCPTPRDNPAQAALFW